MNDNSKAVAATVVGAIIGGLAGYLFFTENGRTWRRQIEPALEDLGREFSSFSATLQKATGLASEGWKLIGIALGEATDRSHRYGNPHQTSPF